MTIGNGQVADANDVLKTLTSAGYLAPDRTSDPATGGTVELDGNAISLTAFTSPLTVTGINDGAIGKVGFIVNLRNAQVNSEVIIQVGSLRTPRGRDLVLAFGDSVTLVQAAPLLDDGWDVIGGSWITPEQSLFAYNHFE